MSKKKHCECQPFKDAQQAGTDNEMYGRLIREWCGEFKAGCDMPPLKFCPWCGKRVPVTESKQS